VQNRDGGVPPRLVRRTRKPGLRHTAIENHARFVQSFHGPKTWVSPPSVGLAVMLKSPSRCTFAVARKMNELAFAVAPKARATMTTASTRTKIHLDTGVGD
jgi:hypothetical protein